MILVIGGTGTLGRRLVPRLLAAGEPVRVLSRHPETAPPAWDGRVDCMAGDVRSREDVAAAMTGVRTVISLAHGFAYPERDALQTVDRAGNIGIIDAAKAVGAGVILMSIVRADQHRVIEVFRVKHDAEQYLHRSGVPGTVVRSTAYMETWLDVMEQNIDGAGRPLVFGRGRNPVNFVAADDVAALVMRCIADGSTRRRTLDIGGPENLTLNAFAAAVQRAAGRRGATRHMARAALRAAHLMRGPQPMLARQAQVALLMDTADMTFDSAPLHASVPGLPVTTLAQVLARQAAPPESGGDSGAHGDPGREITDHSLSLRFVQDLMPEPGVHLQRFVG